MKRLLLLATLSSLSPLVACVTPRMAVSPPLSGHASLPVERGMWSRDVAFGAYATREVDESWVKSQGFTLFGGSLHEAEQQVGFELARGGQRVWRGGCVNQLEEGGVKLGGLKIKNEAASFQCELLSERFGRWQLRIARSSRGDDFAGTFTDGTRTYQVRSSSTLEGGSSLFDAVGFHLASTDSAAAAVQVMSPAQVWFAPGLGDDEELLAGASTALLMYTRLEVR
jgi:hypothetical protein